MKITEKFLDVMMSWLARNGIDDLNLKIDNEFCYNLIDNEITIGVMSFPEVDQWTQEYWNELGIVWININPMVLKFLHEIGHYYTIQTFTNDELMIYNLSKPIVDLKAADAKNKMYEYWQMPDEMVATRWAIDFLNNEKNEYRVQELNDIFEIFWEDVMEEVCAE